jgi:hypothetical protein
MDYLELFRTVLEQSKQVADEDTSESRFHSYACEDAVKRVVRARTGHPPECEVTDHFTTRIGRT